MDDIDRGFQNLRLRTTQVVHNSREKVEYEGWWQSTNNQVGGGRSRGRRNKSKDGQNRRRRSKSNGQRQVTNESQGKGARQTRNKPEYGGSTQTRSNLHKQRFENPVKEGHILDEEYREMAEMSVFPTREDLLSCAPGIRKNVVEGAYTSRDHYLMVQFRLLREDFMGPLREGITGYRQGKAGFFSKEENSGIIVYRDVKITGTYYDSGDFAHVVKLGPNVRWMSVTSSLTYGTLVLFTTNNFQSFFVGTVNELIYETEMITVKLDETHHDVVPNVLTQTFVMVASAVFFEPYLHVLRALKNMRKKELPMEKYIVQVNRETRPPAYLQKFNQKRYMFGNTRFDPLQTVWPDFTNVKFNPSQQKAFKAALTNEFVAIQGPPGTGKTFLACQIVSALLDNVPANAKPILVVCYKNHALDQFLENILKKTNSIIRMGSRSQNESLADYTIKNIRLKSKRGYGYYRFKKELDELTKRYSDIQNSLAFNKAQMIELEREIREVEEEKDRARNDLDLSFLQQADVVGLTTTAAARLRPMLNQLGAKIVVVEEAAEVLESHVVAALSSQCQHVILIGDHKQLRPNPAVYDLCRRFDLDVSLFERLVKNGLGCHQLNVQHRMRPEFSSLITPAIYEDLRNHLSTEGRPSIRGVSQNLFFINHSHPEERVQRVDAVTHMNKHEAQFVIHLADYLVRQGYSQADITILATYSGQVKEINRLRSDVPNCANVKVSTVDDFQGQESLIVILSLVRSNKKGIIGFLNTENRVCVALSRARNGFYIIGNMDQLSKTAAIWRKVKNSLNQHNALGSHLSIYCTIHRDSVRYVSEGCELKVEGGCHRKCGALLPCGHPCNYRCHLDHRDHQGKYRCSTKVACRRESCKVPYGCVELACPRCGTSRKAPVVLPTPRQPVYTPPTPPQPVYTPPPSPVYSPPPRTLYPVFSPSHFSSGHTSMAYNPPQQRTVWRRVADTCTIL